jgi:hypothetical protein
MEIRPREGKLMGPGHPMALPKPSNICALLCAFLIGIAASSCVKACPYRVSVERVP